MIYILTSVGMRRGKNETNAYWYVKLLGGYWRGEADEPRLPLCGDSTDAEEETLLGFGARPWWCVTSDEYIYGNLARHLVGADRSMELGALLLDVRWTHLRMSVGGYHCT